MWILIKAVLMHSQIANRTAKSPRKSGYVLY
jgi:hypothetical protein